MVPIRADLFGFALESQSSVIIRKDTPRRNPSIPMDWARLARKIGGDRMETVAKVKSCSGNPV
jgi:hypothetical protein